MNAKYFLHLLKSLPLLPIIYYQGKKIKKNIPLLPEAKDPEGFVDIDADKSLKILFIGESSFAGVGAEFHKNSFAGHFSNNLSVFSKLNIDWKVYAKTGYNVSKIQQRILPKITETTCDLLVIGIGGNDSFELTPPKIWNKYIQLLINDLQDKFPTTPILFAHLPTIESFPAFTRQIRFVMVNHKNLLAENLSNLILKNENIYYPPQKINIGEWMGKLNKNQTILDFFSDGVHPSELTYELWAKDCVQYLSTSNIDFS